MKTVQGNLFDSDCSIMVHQVNCLGLMGSGVAKEVKERFPDVEDRYRILCSQYKNNPKTLLGTAQIIKQGDIYIVNLFGQEKINPLWYLGGRVTDYEALKKGFKVVRDFMESKKLKKLGLPCGLGCVRGGGKWEEVSQIIKEIFDGSDIEVVAYEL